MKKSLFILFLIFSVLSLEGVCRKCEELRAYFRKNPQKYDYYEEYLEELKEKGEELPAYCEMEDDEDDDEEEDDEESYEID